MSEYSISQPALPKVACVQADDDVPLPTGLAAGPAAEEHLLPHVQRLLMQRLHEEDAARRIRVRVDEVAAECEARDRRPVRTTRAGTAGQRRLGEDARHAQHPVARAQPDTRIDHRTPTSASTFRRTTRRADDRDDACDHRPVVPTGVAAQRLHRKLAEAVQVEDELDVDRGGERRPGVGGSIGSNGPTLAVARCSKTTRDSEAPLARAV